MYCHACDHSAMEPLNIKDLQELLHGHIECRVCGATSQTGLFADIAIVMLCEKAGITGPQIYAEATKDE